MRRGCFRLYAWMVLLVTVAVACSRSDAPTTPTATLGPAPDVTEVATSETPSEDPYAIPAEIDKEYVELVLEALSTSIALAAQEVVREGTLTAQAEDLLTSTHRGPALTGIVTAFEDAVEKGRVERFFSAEAKAADIKVREVISATSSCVFTLVLQDTSGLGPQRVEPFPAYYQLGLKASASDGNPTPWQIVADGEPLRPGQKYADPCK